MTVLNSIADFSKMYRESESALKYRIDDLRTDINDLEKVLNNESSNDLDVELSSITITAQRVLDEIAIYKRFRNEAKKAIRIQQNRELEGEMAAI